MPRPISDDALRRELLRLAREPGCIVCRAARAAVDRFFAWYVIEQYHEPPIIRRMQEARGFCPAHTRQFIRLASPDLVSTVYRDLLANAVMLLKPSEREVSLSPQPLAAHLRPQIACLACEHAETTTQRILRALPVELADSQVRTAFVRPSALCFPHFICVLPLLDWELARVLARAALDSLVAAAGAQRESDTLPSERVRLLAGIEPADELIAVSSRTGAPDAAATDRQALATASAPDPERTPDGRPAAAHRHSWSPTLDRLAVLLAIAACPLCTAEEDVAETYLRWLADELSGPSPSQAAQAADDALWLCRHHWWRFTRSSNAGAVIALLDHASAYWKSALHALNAGLDQPPPGTVLVRYWRSIVDVWQETPRLTPWSALREGFRRGRRSPAEHLADLRRPLLQPRPCPVCRFQRERVERLSALLDAALADSATAHRYEASVGTCFHHLPQALAHSTNSSSAHLLLHAAYTRLAVILWELEEYARKRDWTHRWEPKGDEQHAWRRAVMQYSAVSVHA